MSESLSAGVLRKGGDFRSCGGKRHAGIDVLLRRSLCLRADAESERAHRNKEHQQKIANGDRETGLPQEGKTERLRRHGLP